MSRLVRAERVVRVGAVVDRQAPTVSTGDALCAVSTQPDLLRRRNLTVRPVARQRLAVVGHITSLGGVACAGVSHATVTGLSAASESKKGQTEEHVFHGTP